MRPPSVDTLARSLADIGLPHPLLVDVAREAIAAGDPDGARALAERLRRRLLGRVVNATGVILHTNLGRAPLPIHDEGGYRNLELDLETGGRGDRSAHAGGLLARLCDAEDALVVNNGAAAVLLLLRAIAVDRPVIVSRGELVEIGGGFRIPEILAESGARMIEVGTTNRTRLADYRRALGAAAGDGIVLKVHPSNYRITGFTESVGVDELASLGVPVVVDVGSGLLDAACPWLAGGRPSWLHDEPGCKQTLVAGAAAITFSGDKLLGGPQAGVIAGSRELVERCRRQPLARAIRPGSHVLAAMQEVALAYLRRDAAAIPLWRMASESTEALRTRAERIAAAVDGVKVVDSDAVVGGGSAPGAVIPSIALAVEGDHAARLRAGMPPVVARVVDGVTLADLRTVDPADDEVLAAALRGG